MVGRGQISHAAGSEGKGQRGRPGSMRAGKWQWASGKYMGETTMQEVRGERRWSSVNFGTGRKEMVANKW